MPEGKKGLSVFLPGDDLKQTGKERDLDKKKTSLKRKMVFYFLLVALANVFVAMELLWEIRSDDYRDQVLQVMEKIQAQEQPVEYIFTVLDRLTEKFVIMVGILILVSAIVLFLFVVQIASPIQFMINQAQKIAKGDLSVTVDIKSEDEIADLGNLINDLTVNLQEIIVQLRHMYNTLEEVFVCMNAKLSLLPEIKKYFKEETQALEDNVENIAMIQNSFTLFQVKRFSTDELSMAAGKLMKNLLKGNEINQEEYDNAIKIQKERGGFLGAVLKEQGYIDDRMLLKYMGM